MLSSSRIKISEILAKDDKDGKGDLIFVCEDGDVRGIRSSIVSIASSVLAGALECEDKMGHHQIEVGCALNQAVRLDYLLDILMSFRLMGLVRPGLSSFLVSILCIRKMLSLFRTLPASSLSSTSTTSTALCMCIDFLVSQIPSLINSDPKSPMHAIKWISISAELHLDNLYEKLMEGMWLQINSNILDPRVFTSDPVTVKPPKCTFGYTQGHVNCSKWCLKCKTWRCSQQYTLNACVQCCQGVLHAPPKPELDPSIKALSSEIKDEMLAVLAAYCTPII